MQSRCFRLAEGKATYDSLTASLIDGKVGSLSPPKWKVRAVVSGCRRRGVTIAETLMVGAIGAAMLGLLLPAISAAIANAQGSHCRNNLARLAQALNAYHDAQGYFPPAMSQPATLGAEQGDLGAKRKNWLIYVLPYLGEQALYDSVNWSTYLTSTQGNGLTAFANNIPTFSYFTGANLPELQCPSDANSSVRYQVNKNPNPFSQIKIWQYYGRTNYGANGCLMPPFNYGSNTPWVPACGGATQVAWSFSNPNSWKTRGVMGLSTSLSRAQITDGTSKTILSGEMRAGVNEFDLRGIWADGSAAASSAWFHIFGPSNCFWADDSTRFSPLFSSLGPGYYQLLAQQCMPAQNSQSGNPSGNFRSQHAGGILVAMCDGSVRFISNTVQVGDKQPSVYEWAWNGSPLDMGTWERLNASGDGLVVDDSTDPNFSSTVALFILGDMNGDGVMDNFDISAMELALVDPAAYLTAYPALADYQLRGDVNQDGLFNNFDILAFEQMLMGSD